MHLITKFNENENNSFCQEKGIFISTFLCLHISTSKKAGRLSVMTLVKRILSLQCRPCASLFRFFSRIAEDLLSWPGWKPLTCRDHILFIFASPKALRTLWWWMQGIMIFQQLDYLIWSLSQDHLEDIRDP